MIVDVGFAVVVFNDVVVVSMIMMRMKMTMSILIVTKLLDFIISDQLNV